MTPRFLAWATGWATFELLEDIRPATEQEARRIRAEYRSTLAIPTGTREEVNIGPLPLDIIDDPRFASRTHYWMLSTNYVIWAVSPDGVAALRDRACAYQARIAAREAAEAAAEKRWDETMGQILCPECGTVCYGDCGHSSLYK